VDEPLSERCDHRLSAHSDMHVFGMQVDKNKYPAIHQTAAIPKDNERIIPNLLIVTVKINGHLVKALLDSGLLSDFLFSSAAIN
jgi:hypothetical protein